MQEVFVIWPSDPLMEAIKHTALAIDFMDKVESAIMGTAKEFPPAAKSHKSKAFHHFDALATGGPVNNVPMTDRKKL